MIRAIETKILVANSLDMVMLKPMEFFDKPVENTLGAPSPVAQAVEGTRRQWRAAREDRGSRRHPEAIKGNQTMPKRLVSTAADEVRRHLLGVS